MTRDTIKATTSVRDAQFLTIIEQTIATHLDHADLDAARLEREAGLSKAQLFRRLKQLTGFSAANYIRHVRLSRACGLLQTTSLSIGEVAEVACRLLIQPVGTESSTSKTETPTQNMDNADRQLTRQVILTNEETIACKFNPNGFLAEVTLLSKNASGVTTSQTRTTYTYQCL